MKNIIETASGDQQFSTLVEAITAADLVETLSSVGPFTVFAPTNEAFKKLPEGALQALLVDTDTLKSVLTYHVVAGKVMSADVMKLTEATTIEGSMITIDTQSGVKINKSNVISADIECSNGVIHSIDTVLMPE